MSDEKGPGVTGAFERPLNIYRCAYAYVAQARGNLTAPIAVDYCGLLTTDQQPA